MRMRQILCETTVRVYHGTGSRFAVYEYYGDYWHGNPRRFDANATNPHNKTTFGELYEKVLVKENEIRSHGYNLITMWEADWTRWKPKIKKS